MHFVVFQSRRIPPDRGRQPPMTAVWGGGRTPARGRKTHRTRSSYYFKLPTLYESGDLAEDSHAQQMPKVVETATRYLEGGHLLLCGDTWASPSPTSDMARSSGFFSFRVSPPLVLRTLFSASTIQPLKDDDEKLSVWTVLNLSRVHLYQVAKWGVARPKMGTGLKALPNRLSLLLAQTWPFLVVSWAAPEPISLGDSQAYHTSVQGNKMPASSRCRVVNRTGCIESNSSFAQFVHGPDRQSGTPGGHSVALELAGLFSKRDPTLKRTGRDFAKR